MSTYGHNAIRRRPKWRRGYQTCHDYPTGCFKTVFIFNFYRFSLQTCWQGDRNVSLRSFEDHRPVCSVAVEWNRCVEHLWNDTDRGKQSAGRKTYHSATLSTVNLRRTGRLSDPCLCSGLSYRISVQHGVQKRNWRHAAVSLSDPSETYGGAATEGSNACSAAL